MAGELGDLRFYPAAIHALLNGVDGPVGRELLQRTLRVEAGAKRRCPVRTGRLRSSIRHAVLTDARGIYGVVGSDVEYAYYVHEGTRYMRARPFLRDALEDAR